MQLFIIELWELNQDGSLKLNAQGQSIATYALNNWKYFVGDLEPRPQNHDSGAKTLLNGGVIPANQTVE